MAEEKADQTQEKAKRGKKMNKLTLAEIEKKLEEVKSAQGGFSSRYAKELLRRQEILRSQGKK
jgi:hypothetical protein